MIERYTVKKLIFCVIAVCAVVLTALLLYITRAQKVQYTMPAYMISENVEAETTLEFTGTMRKRIFGDYKYAFSGFVVVKTVPFTQENPAWPVDLLFVETDDGALSASGLYGPAVGVSSFAPSGFCNIRVHSGYKNVALHIGSYGSSNFSCWVAAPAQNRNDAENIIQNLFQEDIDYLLAQ